MSDNEDIPDRRNWLQRLEDSVGPQSDPITRLARHIHPYRTQGQVQYLHDYGSLHFPPPKEWLEQHPLTVPKSILHCEGGGRPFSPAVEGGQVIVFWLKQDALMGGVPTDHAHEVLWKRAENLRNALKGQLGGIEPLEYSLYFPRWKFRDALAGESYDSCAALILATSPEHGELLKTTGTQIINQAQMADGFREHLDTDPATGPTTGSTLPAMERLRGLTTPGESGCDLSLRDLAGHLRQRPQLLTREANGKFVLESKASLGRTVRHEYKPAQLGLSATTAHALALPLNDRYYETVDTVPSKRTKPSPAANDAQHYNAQLNKQLADSLSETFRAPFTVGHATVAPQDTRMG